MHIKRTALVLFIFILSLFDAQAIAASVGLVVNGRQVVPATPPCLQNGRVLVPLRTAAESLNASVYYDSQTGQITVSRDGVDLVLTVNSTRATVGDRTLILDVPPRVVEGHTLVPLRFVGEALGVNVAWESGTAYLSENLLHLPGPTRPLSKYPATLYRDGILAGAKLTRPVFNYVEADTRVDIRGKCRSMTPELIVIVEKGEMRSDQPLTLVNGGFGGQVWLPFGPGEYTVTVCSPPHNSTLSGLLGFKARNTGKEDVSNLAPIDWMDWDHPDILALAGELKRENPMETAAAIHDWVARNIEYDLEQYKLIASNQGDFSPERASAILRARSGVCEHFSRLLAALCRADEIPATIVRGWVRRRDGSEEKHAWNKVFVDGRWVAIDATWDAGYIDGSRFVKDYSRNYFDPEPSFFNATHREDPTL
ncbi:MAG: stalk domain-containing protein [Bacillota bacterium]